MKIQDYIAPINPATKVRIITCANELYSGTKEDLLDSISWNSIALMDIGEIYTEGNFITFEV